MKWHLILLWAFFFNLASFQAQETPIERLTIEDGLSQGMIFDILQTRDGFLWIATKDGLNRYDGHNFKVFTNDPFNSFSLAENTVTTLFEDSRGWLWIGTENKGLDLLDPKTGFFHHFFLHSDKPYLSERIAILKIRETADGDIWILKGGVGIFRISIPEVWEKGLPAEPELSRLSRAKQFIIELQDQKEDRIIDFDLRSNGDLLVSSVFRQFNLDPRKNTYQPVQEGLFPNHMMMVVLTREEDIDVTWFINSEKICRLRNGELTTFSIPVSMRGKRRRLLKDEAGHVWIVLDKYVWEIGPGEDMDFSRPDLAIPENTGCVRRDRNGNLWIGTLGYGLYKIYPAKKSFHAGAAGSSIAGVWSDGKGRYYCKSYLSNISAYDPVSGKMSEQTAFPDAGANQESLVIHPDGTTWLLSSKDVMTDQTTLRKYSATGRFIKEYALETKLSHREQLFCGRNGHIWITLGACQLIRFDPVSEKQEWFNFSHLFREKTTSVRISALVEDETGTLWLGTQLGLLKCIPDKQTFNFQLIQADPNNPAGLNNNTIACILPDPVNPGSILWIGTKGGGINRFDKQTQVCQHLTTTDGLPNNVVYGILSDDKNDLWCSTNRGLAKLTPRAGKDPPAFDIATFTVKMGLQDNEFNTSAYFKASSGEMLFGGVNGLNRFFPEELQPDTTPPPVFVVGLEINHLPAAAQLSGPVETLQKLELAYNQNNLSFEFAALDFTDPGKNRFRYQLVGLDEKWVETGASRFAHFSHLAPGRYTFRVQGSNGESVWRETAHPVLIIVRPPWWRSNVAWMLYVLLLVWSGWKLYQAQIRRVKLREQLAFEVREAERIRLMEQMKTNFFNNITHEFRTPLTLIIEPLRQLLNTQVSEIWRSQVQLAERNSRKLLGLVNQLLNMAKIESGTMMPDLRHADFLETFRTVCTDFLHLADQRGIKLNISAPDQIPPFEFDGKMVEIILNNLISNALKFTPAGGQVTVECTDSSSRDAGISVFVRDTGIGIEAHALDKIFDRFFQVDGSSTKTVEGTGIGLSISQELAELMGGNISVQSSAGQGSVFKFWLPVIHNNRLPVFSGEEEELVSDNRERNMALVIEDNAELRAFIKQSIAGAWQVMEASIGTEGLSKAQEFLPDIIVSDVMMPGLDGYSVCHELKSSELTAHIPVVLLTAKLDLGSKIKGLRIGADDYLTKPFNTDELLARMENLVEQRRKLRRQFSPQTNFAAAVTGEPDNNHFLSTPDKEFMRRLSLLLEKHIADENLGVEEFAQKMFISRMQLHRKLKALFNQSATEFIRNYRLNRAMALLKNKEGNVMQVAAMVGFANEKYFSTTFKEHFGVPPSEV